MRRHFFSDYVELYATALCLSVVLVIPRWFGPSRFWEAAAVAGLLVICGHGVFFWVVNRRQERRYAAKIAEVRRMLKDCINNDLTVVMAALTSPLVDSRHPEFPAVKAHMIEATQEIAHTLDVLSPDSLDRWKARYKR
jgi:hypothetical protein